MKIEVKKMSLDEAKSKGMTKWPVWEKEASTFDWHYDSNEQCYILEGDVEIKTASETVKFGAGDYVKFPSGLDCTWHVIKPVKKHYKFG